MIARALRTLLVALLVASLTPANGICTDKSADCQAWMKEDQCSNNAEYMHINCPLSCGMCEHNCSDTSPHCLDWKHQGECENNTRFMLWNCPVSCNLCTPPCEDTHGGFVSGPNANETMCDKWARDGACQGNPDFALKVCPVACNVCKPKCKDLHADCSSWSAAGSCETNPKYMLNNCPASCRVCGHSADVGAEEAKPADDSHGCKNVESAEACAAWKDAGECTENPAFMLRKCAESCELCTHVCQDHLAECSQWAKAGQCEENQGFMKSQCPASCGICQNLDSLKKAKEEL